MTHRDYKADFIRKKKHYKVLKHLLFCVQYKDIQYLKKRVWHYMYKGMTFESSLAEKELAEKELAGLIKDIESSELTVQKIIAISDYMFGESVYMDKIVMQLAQDELPKEAFLFYL